MIRHTRTIVGMLALAAVSTASCTIAKISGRGAHPLLLNNPPARVEVIRHINVSKMIMFDYTAAIDASEILEAEIEDTDFDAIINVVLTLKTDVRGFFLNLITLGLANARTFVVAGDLVKAPEGLGFLNISGVEVVAHAPSIKELVADAASSSGVAGVNMIVRRAEGYALVRYDPDGPFDSGH